MREVVDVVGSVLEWSLIALVFCAVLASIMSVIGEPDILDGLIRRANYINIPCEAERG